MSDDRKQTFKTFSFQGKEYPINSVVKIKKDFYTTKNQFGHLSRYPMVQVVESYINWQGTHLWLYAIWSKNGHIGYYRTSKKPEEIIEHVVETEFDKYTVYYKESEVPEVFTGGCLYLLFLLITLIFKDFWIAWVIGTIYFFSWRSKKLQRPPLKHGFDVEKKVREWNNDSKR